MKTPTHMGRPFGRGPSGFSLVELMVAMTLSLILMAGALSILYSTKLTSAENERVARVQEAGRTAFELIMQDARAAGYSGCARPLVDKSTVPPTSTFSNGVNSATLLWNFGQSVFGFEATSTTAWTPALDPAIPASPTPFGGSDVLVLRAARPGSPIFRANAVTPLSGAITVDRDASASLTASVASPIPAIISDCRGSAAFLVTGFAGAGTTATLSHVAGATIPGNASDNLPRTFDIDATIQPVQTIIYYVASCTAISAICPTLTPPALWQIVGSGAPQELIQGIQAMQVKYGVDTDADMLANVYVTADNVTDWSTVVSINLAVLAESIDQTGVEVDTKQYYLLDLNPHVISSTFGPYNDRRHRSVFMTTITLRNDTT